MIIKKTKIDPKNNFKCCHLCIDEYHALLKTLSDIPLTVEDHKLVLEQSVRDCQFHKYGKCNYEIEIN